MTTSPGVLVARHDGITHVPNAVAVTPDVVELLDDILDGLSATPEAATPEPEPEA
jgi:hypothetical protein